MQLSKVQEEPLAQSVEQQPFKLWVAGSNPARLTKGPHRLEAQDTALSRRKHEFESHWGRHTLPNGSVWLAIGSILGFIPEIFYFTIVWFFMKKNSLGATPLLDEVRVEFSEDTDFKSFPFSLPIIKNLKDIHFPAQVTFFVGENGAGKSTLLEAIAYKAGFGAEGGSKNINFKTSEESSYTAAQLLGDQLVLSWRKKPKDGYFFRAER